jgi:hypothetical protein
VEAWLKAQTPERLAKCLQNLAILGQSKAYLYWRGDWLERILNPSNLYAAARNNGWKKRYTTLLGIGTPPHGVGTPPVGVKSSSTTPAARKRYAATRVGLLLIGIGTSLVGIGQPCGLGSERCSGCWCPCHMELERHCRVYGEECSFEENRLHGV